MDFLTVALQVLPFVNTLMKLAEGLFGKGAGSQKKALVMEGARDFVTNMQSVSTGGQLETWKRIEAPLGDVIDATAKMLFPNEVNGADESFKH